MASSRRSQISLLTTGTGGLVLNGWGQSVFGPALPGYVRLYGLTETGAGFLISVFWAGALLGVITLILWPARLSARWCFASLAVGAGLIATQAGWPVVLLGAALFGFGDGGIATIFNRRFLTEFAGRGPAMLGLLNAVYCIGAIFGPLTFVAFGSDPQRTYLLLAAVAAAFVPFAMPGPRETPDLGQRTRIRPVVLLFGIGSVGFEAAMIGLGPTALIAEGVSEPHAAQLASLFFVAYLAARIIAIWLAPKVPAFTLFTACLFLAGLGALAASMAQPGLFYVASGAAVALIFPSNFIFASAAMGGGARTSAMIMAGCLFGGIAVPSLVGPAMTVTGWDAFALMAGLGLAIAFCAVLFGLRAADGTPQGT